MPATVDLFDLFSALYSRSLNVKKHAAVGQIIMSATVFFSLPLLPPLDVSLAC